MKPMKLIWLGFLLALAATAVATPYADRAKPLLMPGKQSLYQRVLAAPGANLAQSPVASESEGEPVSPFTALYVYAREQDAAAKEWLQVGTDRFGTVIGWLPASRTLEWHQGLTVVAVHISVGRIDI